MKKLFRISLCTAVLLVTFSPNAFAQPPEEEINEVLEDIGWDMNDLTSYLEYYEMSLEDFETGDDLRTVLGTPITSENLNNLLVDYSMSREELDTLLAGFGETVEEDYFFIEDLDTAVDFYLNHDAEMKELEDFLTTIEITEEEADNLFNHFMSLDQLNLETQMEQLGARLESLMMEVDPEAQFTDEQQTELVSIWEEMMGTYEISPKFFLVDAGGSRTPISFAELAAMVEFPADALFVELYNTEGTKILDFEVSAEMLGSEFAIDAGDKMTEIGDLAGELTEIKHEKLPDTASPYAANMLIGIAVMLAGAGLLLYRLRRRITEEK